MAVPIHDSRCRARSVTERDEIGKVDQRMKVDDSGELPCGLHDLHSRLSRLGSQFPEVVGLP